MSKLQDKYPIQTWENNPILRTKSNKIIEITRDIKQFSHDLLHLMREYDWVGLAAPQIWQNIRMIAVTQRNKNRDKCRGEIIMINPVIIEKSREMNIDEEACLSLPEIFGKVKRHNMIIVEYLDELGNQHKKKFKGFEARIIQHEVDHLDAILFTDKVIKK